MRAPMALLCIVIIPPCFVACRPKSKDAQVEAPYTETESAVAVDILPLGSSGESRRWLATYTDSAGDTTKFDIEFGETKAEQNSALLASGQGQFLAEAGSDPVPLLSSLKSALQAKRVPRNVQRVDSLPFTFALLGTNQSRSDDGSFQEKPKGNWTTTKIFLANEQAEVYFNYNPVLHKAEFSLKDPDYGDKVLAELAKVF